MTIQIALLKGQKILESAHKSNPRLDAELLLGKILNFNKAQSLCDASKTLSSRIEKKYFNLIKKRTQGLPVAILTGQKEFYGHTFKINKSVLQPRPETEEIVTLAIVKSKDYKKSVKILDLGTGCGCIAISMAIELQKLEIPYKITAIDISKRALNIAEENAKRLVRHSDIIFLQSDLLRDIPLQKFDIIAANLPYIPENILPALEPEVLNEPKLALLGGTDGLKYYRKLRQQIDPYLHQKSLLLFECSYLQEKELTELFSSYNIQIVI